MPWNNLNFDISLLQVITVVYVWVTFTAKTAAQRLPEEVSYVTACVGNGPVTLQEAAPPEADIRAVFVYKGSEILGSDVIPAGGDYKNRLRISRQGQVTLSDIRLSDSGVFKVEMAQRSTKTTVFIVLFLPESPKVEDNMLRVNNVLSLHDQRTLRLTCGYFTTLGYPPVHVLWQDPDGRLLSSSGYKDGYFYLNITDASPPGNYTCFLDCPAPNTCCLSPESGLLQEAKAFIKPCLTCSSKREMTAPKLTPEMTSVLQKIGEAMAAGMAALVNDQIQDTMKTNTVQLEDWKDKVENKLTKKIKVIERDFQKMLEDKLQEIDESINAFNREKNIESDNSSAVNQDRTEADLSILHKLQDSLSLIQQQTDERNQNMSEFQQSLQRKINIFQKKIKGIRRNVKRYGVVKHGEMIKNLTDEMKARFDEIYAKLSDWESTHQLSDEEIFAKFQQTVTEIDDRMEQSRTKLGHFLENITDRIEDLHKNVTSLADTIQTHVKNTENVHLRYNSALDAASRKFSADDNDGVTTGTTTENHKESTTIPTAEKTNGRIPTINDDTAPENCLVAQRQGGRRSGPYTLKPTGLDAQSFWCDMDKGDGGWLVFQRRKNGSVDFYRPWKDYVEGFGDQSSDGEFWLGLDKLHAITRSRPHSLRVDLMNFDGVRGFALYRHFRVHGPRQKYAMSVFAHSGTAGDSLVVHNKPFSTKDKDNDEWSDGHCARNYRSAWWYAGCRLSDLNAPYKRGRNGIMWLYGDDLWGAGKIVFTEMKIRPQ